MEKIACVQFEFRREDESWQPVRLPHSAWLEPEVIGDQHLGVVYYRHRFFAPPEWRTRAVYFTLGAAMQRTGVRLNGQYLFTHLGGYDRWVFALSDLLRFGEENELEFTPDNRPAGDMPPGKPLADLDFCYYSGLYRDAELLIYDPIHISDPQGVAVTAGGGLFVRTLEATPERARLELRCHVVHEVPQCERHTINRYADGTYPCSLKVRLSDGGEFRSEEVNLRQNCDHTFALELVIDRPRLWHPAAPELYSCEVEVEVAGQVVDRGQVRFGVRTIEISKADGLVISGRKVEIIGTNRHQDYPFIGNALTPEAQRRDAAIIRRAGYNLVRLAHYNQHPAFLDACDELGICVIPCIPGWQIYHANDAFFTNLFRDCRTLIRSYRNHPSAVMWEVCLNETYPPCWINAELHKIAHEEYPGPNFYTCGDVLGLFEGWDVLYYRPGLETDKPILMREYGDWGFGGNESTSRRRRGDGEKAMLQQAWNFQWTLNRIRGNRDFLGGANWAMFDYNRGYHPDLERSGDADIYRVPRYKYYFYMSQRDPDSDGPMVYLAADWNRLPGRDKVVVYSNCDEVELFCNGVSLGRRGPDDGPDTPYSTSGTSPGWETAALWYADGSGGN
ncbi:MAG: glycoside hydrolase family 2 TIM barrel-domain containing protein, partial [Victivallaceae bacterium]